MPELMDNLAKKKGLIITVTEASPYDRQSQVQTFTRYTGRFESDTTLDTIWRWAVQACKGRIISIDVRLDDAFEPRLYDGPSS